MLHWPWLENIGQDLRYALRMLARSPYVHRCRRRFAPLGIGLNTAIFNVINALLLQSAPVAQPARLVALFNTGRSNGSLDSLGPPDYESYRDGAAAFEIPGPRILPWITACGWAASPKACWANS